MPIPTDKVGLIAGNGRFPLIFAREAKRAGVRVIAVAHRGETQEDLQDYVDALTWIRVGELGKIVRTFHQAGVKHAVMAGGIKKVRLLSNFRPDLRGLAFLARMKSREDDQLLRGVAAELERDGIAVLESTLFLSQIIPSESGALGRRVPTGEEWEDIKLGMRAAKGLGELGIGQTVVVKRGVILAVEAVEGTDAAIRRGGGLARGGVVVVKMSKPQQDLRFDVPAVGAQTVQVLGEVGGGVLAVERDKSVLLEKEELLDIADRLGISVVAVSLEDA